MKLRILIIGIFLLGVLLRFYQLGVVPKGMTNDEADVGYDAYSILHTGKDQWGESFPLVSFRGFGDYRPPLYTYLTVVSIALFGPSQYAVRVPAAFFGSLSILLIYLLGSKLLSREIGAASAFIFAISPWDIGLSRIGIESNVGIFLILLAIYLFIQFSKKRIALFVSSLVFALTLYTYSAYALFTPLVILSLVFMYRRQFQNRKKDSIIFLILLLLFVTPIMLKKNSAAATRFTQVSLLNNISSIGVINVLNEQQGSCRSSFPNSICKLADNKVMAFTTKFIDDYLNHFTFTFLYILGTPTQYSILPDRGLEYLFEAAFLLLGFLYAISQGRKASLVVLALLFLSPIPDSLTGEGNYSRASNMLPFLILVEGLGIVYSLSLIRKLAKPSIIRLIQGIISIVVFYSFFSFTVNYFTYFKVYYDNFSEDGYKSLMERIYLQKDSYNTMYISSFLNDTKQYIYYLFFNHYDPKRYQEKQGVSWTQTPNGWIDVSKIDTINFVSKLPFIASDSARIQPKILFIANPNEFAPNVRSQFTIYDARNNPVFVAVTYATYINQESLPKKKRSIGSEI